MLGPDPLRQKLAQEYAAKRTISCPHCFERLHEAPASAYEEGWQARDDRLHAIIFGDDPSFDPVELATKAYTIGRNDESEGLDELLDKLEVFIRKVHGGNDSSLIKEAGNLLDEIQANKD